MNTALCSPERPQNRQKNSTLGCGPAPHTCQNGAARPPETGAPWENSAFPGAKRPHPYWKGRRRAARCHCCLQHLGGRRAPLDQDRPHRTPHTCPHHVPKTHGSHPAGFIDQHQQKRTPAARGCCYSLLFPRCISFLFLCGFPLPCVRCLAVGEAPAPGGARVPATPGGTAIPGSRAATAERLGGKPTQRSSGHGCKNRLDQSSGVVLRSQRSS